MFTFSATPVKFIGLLVFFAFCTAWCLYELTRRQDTRQRVSNGLHLLMSVVMLGMVSTVTWAPVAAVGGTPVLAAVFALATLWFAWLAFEARGAGRGVLLASVGHAAMFAAMTWHLTAMAMMSGAKAAAGQSMPGMGAPASGMTPGMGATAAAGHGGMGMGMGSGSGMGSAMEQASQPGGTLWIFALIGLPLMAYLLVAGVRDVRRALLPRAAASVCHCGADCTCGPDCTCEGCLPASDEVRLQAAQGEAGASGRVITLTAPALASCHAVRPVGTTAYRLSAVSDAAMNLGMFWMSTGLLVPIAAFMKVFAF